MIKAVLFDLDGTLADTAPDLGYALNQQRELHGLAPLAQAEIRPQASHGARGLLKLGFNITPQDASFAAMREEYLQLYQTHICDHTQLFSGTLEILAELERRGILWGVVTNKPTRFTRPLLEKLGLAQRTACVISGDTTANAKPHPEPLLHACKEIGLACTECLYIGDAERDVQAAVAAHMRVLIARYGYIDEQDQPEIWGAHGMIDTPGEILSYL